MKIGIISDSHDDVGAVQQALDILQARSCSFLIHAGDLCSPFIARLIRDSGLGHKAVFGNNDGDRVALSALIDIAPPPRHITLDGESIIIFREPFINEYIDPSRVALLVYGHTHLVDVSFKQDMRIVNPGALSGVLVGKKTCAVYHTGSREVESIEL